MKTLLILTILAFPLFSFAAENYCGDDTYAGASMCSSQQECSSHCSSMSLGSAWVTYPENPGIPSECHCALYENGATKLIEERKQELYYW